MPLSISDTAAQAILTAAGVDPAMYDTSTVRIDVIPDTGPCTVRATALLNADSAAVRAILRTEFTDPEES